MANVSVSSGDWEELAPASPACTADAFDHAVRVVKRTLLRHSPVDPMDDELARLLVRVLVTVLAEGGHPEKAAEVGAAFAEATGLDVVITAAGVDR
jgi:ribosomal protein L10